MLSEPAFTLLNGQTVEMRGGGAEGRQRRVNEGENFWGGILLFTGFAGVKWGMIHTCVVFMFY